MTMRIRLDIAGDVQLDRRLARASAAVEDMRPAWDALADKFAADNTAQFDSEGARASGGWAALSPRYAERKARLRPGRPILEFDGDLRRSLTERPFGIESISAREMRVGTDVPYARFHQFGTPNMPQRRPVELTEVDRQAWARIIQRHLVDAIRKAMNA